MTSPQNLQQTVLHQTLNADLIVVHAEISSAKKLLEKMAHILTQGLDGEVREKDIYHQLLEREKLGNTGIGNGIALPHSRCEQATTAVVAIISISTPVDYDSADKQAVDLAFGLLVPVDASQVHLNLLADIARLMSDSEKKKQLTKAQSSQEIIKLIDTWSTQA